MPNAPKCMSFSYRQLSFPKEVIHPRASTKVLLIAVLLPPDVSRAGSDFGPATSDAHFRPHQNFALSIILTRSALWQKFRGAKRKSRVLVSRTTRLFEAKN